MLIGAMIGLLIGALINADRTHECLDRSACRHAHNGTCRDAYRMLVRVLMGLLVTWLLLGVLIGLLMTDYSAKTRCLMHVLTSSPAA